MYCDSGSTTIINSQILQNTATYGGGIYITGSANMNFINSTLQRNSGSQEGGGLFCESSGTIISTNNSTISNNTEVLSDNIFCAQPCFGNSICCFGRGLGFDFSNNCADCAPTYYGSTCSNQCPQCNVGVCSSGIHGTGKCICISNSGSNTTCTVNNNSKTGAIIGGVLGAVCAIVLIISIIYYYKFRKLQSNILTEEEMQAKFGLDKMDVFISYCWAQKEIVKKLKRQLDEAGIKSWMDIEQMVGGRSINASMEEGITNATLIIVLLSNEYANSINCNKEIKIAVVTKKQIIPLLVGSLDSYPPKGMKIALKDKLYIDITEGNFDTNVSKVINTIKDYLKKSQQINYIPDIPGSGVL